MFIFFLLTVLSYLHGGIIVKKLFSKDMPQIDSFTNANHTSAVKQTYAREVTWVRTSHSCDIFQASRLEIMPFQNNSGVGSFPG